MVDDNAHARAFLAQILSAVDMDVVQADSGPAALIALKGPKPNAIFVDMFMPRMDGISLTRAIRALPQPQVAKLPIIMVSAQVSRDVVQRGAAAGVTAFLAKPFTASAVLKHLAAALAPSVQAQPAPEPTADDQSFFL
ncbi:MAG: response regulator [Caulobacter sp.]|nr:response regulator [Caulobacter sp.]